MHLRPTYRISTERLSLRPLAVADLDELLTYRGREDVCRYLPFAPMTRESLATRLAGDLSRTELTEQGQALTLGVTAEDTGRLIGDVVLFFRSREHAAGEIGYVFHPDVAGHGYATEACTAVLGLAFQQLGLHRVIARLDSRNTASARLAARLGMRREAHFVRNEMFKGEWTDEVVYAMLADQWRTRAAVPGERHSRLVDGRQHTYSSERLWRLSQDLPVVEVPIADIAEFDADCWFHGNAPTCRQVAEHARRIQGADLAHPVILSANGSLMDGGHRIAKAWLAGATTVRAVRFPVDPAPDHVDEPG